ncbi:MAG: sulfurtransferase [Flavobacteriaceae bacterium]
MNTGIKIGFIWLFLSFLSCKESGKPGTIESDSVRQAPLIEVEDLQNKMGKSDVIVIDMRKPEYYMEGHIEGAVNIWRDQLEDSSYPYGGMMATKDSIESLLSQLGISNRHSLVIYDDRGCPDAARLWWLLKFYNFEKVSLLNGGLEAWEASGMGLNREAVLNPPAKFKFPESGNTDILIDKEDLIARMNSNSNMILVDTRTRNEYQGSVLKDGAKKPGRIKGSIHIDWAEAINFKDHKKIRPADQVRQLYNKYGITEKDTVVVYCHSGSRSALTTFVLSELLGYPNVMNYDGSWTEWSYFDQLPYEQDSVIKTKSL